MKNDIQYKGWMQDCHRASEKDIYPSWLITASWMVVIFSAIVLTLN